MAGAQVYGDLTFGCADESTTLDLYAASVSMDLTSNVGWGMNHVGDEAALSIGNVGGSLNISGLASTADTLGAALGDALEAGDIGNSSIFTVNNTANAFNAITVWYVTGGNLSRNQAGFEEGSLEMVGRVALTDTTPTAVT